MPLYLNFKRSKTWSRDPQTLFWLREVKYLLVTHVKCTKIILLIFSEQKKLKSSLLFQNYKCSTLST